MVKGKKMSKKKKLTMTVYFLLRGLVILSLIAQGIHGNWHNVFLCILTLILFTFPSLMKKTFNMTFPTTFEIIVYCFIFASEILGEIQNFYGIFAHWDTMLHTLNGFLCAALGFSSIDILNNMDEFHFKMTPAFVGLVAFCFSMTIGVLWEFGEYTVDVYLNKDMQRDRVVEKITSKKLSEDEITPIELDGINKTVIYTNDGNTTVIEDGYLDIGLHDTMKDLFVNFIGAVVFSILGYFYIKNRDGYRFAEIFIPRLRKTE